MKFSSSGSGTAKTSSSAQKKKSSSMTFEEDVRAEMKRESQALSEKMCRGSLLTACKFAGDFPENEELDNALFDLIGSVILNVGFHPAADEGGLAIDYEKGDGNRYRIVLGFTDLGMWKYFQGCLRIGKNRNDN